MSDAPRTAPPAPRARAHVRRTWFPGWIWAVPLAAVAVVGWLLVHALTRGGTDITIAFADVHGLTAEDADVVYRGTSVGHVSDVSLADDGRSVTVRAEIDDDASRFLRSGTIFWLRGAEPSFGDLASLSAVLGGPTLVMDPGPGAETTQFVGLLHKPIRPPDGTPPQRFRIAFADGAVGELKPGDPVLLRGFTVGRIATVDFHVDAASGAIAAPVTVDLFGSLLGIAAPPSAAAPASVREAVASLVDHGLRARLSRDPPLIGDYTVTLDMLPDAGAAALPAGDGVPEIPTAPGGGIDSVVTRLNRVPIDAIAANVLAITARVRTLVASPELADAIAQADAAVTQLRDTIATASPKIDQLVDRLRRAAERIEQTAGAARTLLGGPMAQHGLTATVREADDAARAIRELADYLDRHPEAFIRGRHDD